MRTAIEKIGGTMPEDLPTPEKYPTDRKRADGSFESKSKKGKLMLDEWSGISENSQYILAELIKHTFITLKVTVKIASIPNRTKILSEDRISSELILKTTPTQTPSSKHKPTPARDSFLSRLTQSR